jgi:hypothetical protein
MSMEFLEVEITEVVNKLEKGKKSTAQTMNVMYPDVGHTLNFLESSRAVILSKSLFIVLRVL